ncbi:hypothetical protein BKA61DRAFT_199926 [Leptodontidium sp. MPI-SDFR-AT-0119]|nr:hypothetical protein BKA61DRAFT_199926 [Leptodontidium sp. MPI-SDFR-AT-0119]
MATHVQPSTQQHTPTPLPPPAPTEFHLFSSLPLEIRLRIYTLSLPSPRLIPLVYTPPTIQPRQYHSEHHHYRQQQDQNQPQQPTSTSTPQTPIPHITILPYIYPQALLHTTHESRVYIQTLYTPCLPLSDHPSTSLTTFSPDHPHPQPQPLYRPTHDIIHLPSLSGYNASFKNFTAIHTLAATTALKTVRRLAVSEDVFLEEEKKRWRRVELAGAGSREVEVGSSRDRCEKGVGGGVVLGVGRGEGGIDGVTVRNLEGFWDVVRRKFGGLEEVWILSAGMEGRVLDEEIDGGGWRLDRVFDGSDVGGGGDMTRKRRMSFEEKVERAVKILEDETGWAAPSWRILGCGGEERDLSSPEMEVIGSGEMSKYYLGGSDRAHKQ